jgi:hypothetical protein
MNEQRRRCTPPQLRGSPITWESALRRRAMVRCRTRPGCDPGRSSRCWRWTGLCAVSSAIAEIVDAIISTPDDHFAASPYCRVVSTTNRWVDRAGSGPTICAGSISAPGVHYADRVIVPSPNDHFAATPHGCVRASTSRRVCHTDGSPTISGGIVPAAAV